MTTHHAADVPVGTEQRDMHADSQVHNEGEQHHLLMCLEHILSSTAVMVYRYWHRAIWLRQNEADEQWKVRAKAVVVAPS